MKIFVGFRRICLGIGLLVCQAGEAAEIRIHVSDRQLGNALEHASVCLGTPANPVQFGGQFTGENGYAVFEEVPETPLILTVSRPEYTGYQRRQTARRFDITLRVGLATGGLGPICDLGEVEISPALTDGPVTISTFRLDDVAPSGGGREVRLNAVVTGNPTHYRVAEHWGFEGVEWIEYKSQPLHEISEGAGEKRVYFQVRRMKQLDGAQVESLSGIAQATIYLND